ncbi:MAG: acyl--CoA ligase, partial [Clostridiales bacterium]|nr:acyl--CoA ligase [Clostridiales bacterium]
CEKKKGAPLRVLCLNEYCYVYGFLMGIHNVLLSGQTLLIYTWFESNSIMPPIRLYKPDTLVAFSGTLARLNAPSGSVQALKNARFLFSAGVPLTLAQKAGIVDRMAYLGVKPEIHSFYGNSELFEFLYCMPELDGESAVGIPLPDVLVKIVDRAAFLDMPAGREGEFAVHSPAMCTSFLMRDGTHYSPFRKLSDGRSWLLTEDIGIENEGGVFFRYGSVRGGFKIKSATVYPSKVEKVIELVAGVKAVACVVTDTVEGPVLTAAVVPEEDYFYDNDAMQKLEERINDECSSMLAEPMRPADICFFAAIPKSSNGRFDYAELGKRVTEIHAQMEDIDEADIEADIE